MVRLGVYLHERLAVAPVRRLHLRDNRLAGEQLFLLRFVVPFQRRGFQGGIEYHIRLSVIHADKGEAGTAFDGFAVLVADADGKHGRVSPVADFIEDTHRQVLDHLLCETETGQCRIRKFDKFKSYFIHTLILF